MKVSKLKFLPEIEERINQVKEEIVFSHEACGGRGYHSLDDDTSKISRRGRPCGCMTVFKYVKELIKSNIPQDYWELDFDSLDLDKLNKTVIGAYMGNLKKAKQNGLGLVFFGQNGTGKTSSMIEIAKEGIVQLYKIQYFTLSSYVDAVLSKDAKRVEWYESGDFLLIDELDKKAGTPAIYKLIDEFFRRMFNLNKSLIFATNWDADEMKEHLGESTYSLLKRRSEFLVFQGADFSDNLQESYVKRLKRKYNYFSLPIINRAFDRDHNLEMLTDGDN